jgi:hypothetical protein
LTLTQDRASGGGVGGDVAPGGFLAWSLEHENVEEDAADCKAVDEAEAKLEAQRRGTHASRQQVRRPTGYVADENISYCACALYSTPACRFHLPA